MCWWSMDGLIDWLVGHWHTQRASNHVGEGYCDDKNVNSCPVIQMNIVVCDARDYSWTV